MKQNKSVKRAGPFYVTSHSQGRGVVSFIVYPAFPDYDHDGFKWAESRYHDDGGGPGIFTSIGTSRQLEEFLNSVYSTEQITTWKNRIEAILKDETEDKSTVECEKCCTVSFVPNEWKHCPICGGKYKRV